MTDIKVYSELFPANNGDRQSASLPSSFYILYGLTYKCVNGCKLKNTSGHLNNSTGKAIVSYYQFERIQETNYNRKGQKVVYTRTARVDKKAPLKNIAELLDSIAPIYMEHRFFVVTDDVFVQNSNQNIITVC